MEQICPQELKIILNNIKIEAEKYIAINKVKSLKKVKQPIDNRAKIQNKLKKYLMKKMGIIFIVYLNKKKKVLYLQELKKGKYVLKI